MIWYRYLALTIVAGALLAIGVASADEKKDSAKGSASASAPDTELSPAQKQAQQDIEDLGMALRLADIGEKQKAPEILLSAVHFYRNLANAKISKLDAKDYKFEIVVDKGSDKPVDKELKAPDKEFYAKEADKLIERAREIALNDKGIDLTKLIKEINDRKKDDREVIGGPRTVRREIGPGHWQTYDIEVAPHKPFSIAFKASKPLRIEIVRRDNSNVFGANVIPFGSAIYTPGGPPKGQQFVPVSIRFKNESKEKIDYYFMMQ